jgi:Fe2+ transport system protein FeoA
MKLQLSPGVFGDWKSSCEVAFVNDCDEFRVRRDNQVTSVVVVVVFVMKRHKLFLLCTQKHHRRLKSLERKLSKASTRRAVERGCLFVCCSSHSNFKKLSKLSTHWALGGTVRWVVLIANWRIKLLALGFFRGNKVQVSHSNWWPWDSCGIWGELCDSFEGFSDGIVWFDLWLRWAHNFLEIHYFFNSPNWKC